MTIRKLDYVPRFDEQSRLFAVGELVSSTVRTYRYWYPPRQILDQGMEGACVGFAWTNAVMTAPSLMRARKPNSQARGTYNFAKFIDEWEGEHYEGTSVLAGAKVLHSLGFISEYRWAFSIEQVLDALINIGPVVIGIPWYEGMYDTAGGGLVNVSGELVGGHAICLYGYHPRREFYQNGTHEVVYWRNSWGGSYGINGTGYIKVTDLAALLADQAEACVPIF
jgi:hypothetical protein